MGFANSASVLQTPTRYPFIQIFYNVTGSLPATNAMTALIIILGWFGNLTIMAGSSRQLFAFARDDGMPFSRWISKVTSRARDISTSSIETLTNLSPDSPRRKRSRERHSSHLRTRCHYLPHQHRQHGRFQHRHFSWDRYSHGIVYCVHLVHHLA